MNAACRKLPLLVVVMLLSLFAGCSTPSRHKDTEASTAPMGQVQAGMAEIDITPPVGHRMAGYYDERLATGTHDPLKAKALVLRQGREQIALVFCDLIGLSLN